VSDVDALADGLQDAFNSGDPAAFAAVCALDLHYEDPLCSRPLESVSAFGEHAARLWAAFPDARMESTGPRLRDGDTVAMPVKLLGTHRGEVSELPPTGRFVVVHAVLWGHLDEAGERIWRLRAFFDVWAAAVELGVLPKPGSAGERAMFMLRGFGLRR
jgi:steroid delta-isomerase-like uncharacterized protein